ncbi:MAG TPA: hypothetical protein VK589_04000 [Chryseolinea sp.]|nr:hypothetical protein [Chryseolinea sp.]
MKKFSGCLVLFISLLPFTFAYSQKQLVLLKREKVLLRLFYGDEFIYRLKGSKTVKTSYVNNLYDTAVLAHKEIVPFHKIDRVYFKHSSFGNRVGTMLVIGGVGYFLIDQFNTVVVHGENATIHEGVATTSAVLAGVGLPLMLIKKKSQRIGGKYRLLTAEKGSAFYMPELNRFDPSVIQN